MEFKIDDVNFDEIQEGKVAETGTYSLVISRQEVKPNRAEDGTNFEMDFQIVDDPTAEGITFTTYNALPKPGDAERMTKRAQSIKDFKLQMLKEKVERCGGTIKKNGTISIPDSQMVTAVVEKKMSDANRPYNVLNEDTIKAKSAGKVSLS